MKRFELEKQSELEKMKTALNQYEGELKEKFKKKVENALENQSIDIKNSNNDKKNIRMSTSNKKSQNLFEESFERINPMNLLENFKEEDVQNHKENKKNDLIESNDVQIKKIRNEINDLKNIINVIIIYFFFSIMVI